MTSDRTHSRPVPAHAAACVSLVLACVLLSITACSRSSALPALSNQEFWALIQRLSEPPGTFSLSENFVSNEPYFAENVRWLRPAGGVYIGVGPEQNFSYIARLQPSIAFIVDIREENRSLHLLYKALFELSTDRADFVARLFSRPRPSGLSGDASVEDIFRAYDVVRPSMEEYDRTVALVRGHLGGSRGFRLSQVDLDWIDRALKAFYAGGPAIHFWGSREVQAARPSYRQLMTARDTMGTNRSFLATEEGFRFVKDLHARNLIVPVVGDFAGPTALRRVGQYVRERADVVQAFYGSNVGVYLTNEQARAYCRNLATLPASARAWFIESDGVRSLAAKLRACAPAGRESKGRNANGAES